MVSRLLFAIDGGALDRDALEVAVTFGTTYRVEVRVLRVRKGDCAHGYRYIETNEEAWTPVNYAVFELRMAGVGASGQVVRAPVDQVAQAIEQVARAWGADAVLLGPGRRSRLGRILARPLESRLEEILRLPIIVVPRSIRSGSGEPAPPTAARTP